ncbi:MAG TPA: methyltransferase domain-containing protein [Rhodopila sp.]|nr:methyltransferase domain-containing protein [Rhodopila sp.]
MEVDRPKALLRGIGRSSRLLELGASISPMAPRSAGWNVTIVDHASQEELIEKYRNDPNANVANIEKVDFVWSGGPLHGAIPQELHGTYDVLIASHVIEHIPDLIAFFESARKLLHPEHGVLALAVPDKRWCFDALRPVSTTGQMLEAHLLRRQRHSAATHFDSSAYIVFDGNRPGWGREPLPNLYFPDTLEDALAKFRHWSPDPNAPYVDCHAWYFTPASFRLNVLELGVIGNCDWHIDWLEPRPATEFLTHLRPGAQRFASPQEREQQRMALLKQIFAELREQINWLVEPDLAVAERELRQIRTMLQSSPMLQPQAFQELHQVAETAAMVRTALRPPRAVWHSALPLRRLIARLRGRAA